MIRVGDALDNQVSTYKNYNLIINDMLIPEENGRILFLGITDEKYSAYINDIEVTEMVLDFSFKDATNETMFLRCSYPWDSNGIFEDIKIEKVLENGREKYHLRFESSFNGIENWKQVFSIREYVELMEKIINSDDDLDFEWVRVDEDMALECEIFCETCDGEKIIRSYVEGKLSAIKKISDRVIKELTYNVPNALISWFEFPERVRIPCEQYLLYFIQFLKDLGISAEANLENESGKVLFSVIPTTESVALEQIRDALEVYLQLPSKVNTMSYMNMPTDPKIQQLIANTQHLNSQLMLCNASMQMQAQTIERQQTIINQQQRMLDATILQTSLVTMSTSGKEEDKEELFGGTVALKKYEGKGFEVNVANIYRWIKSQFHKE
ncbi:hypothetical protein [Bacillus cereus]|uniref:hypothetical protein n=1 Tax=Bacillus cereus TaxID=1396 RepID=UPI002407276E|nr:hypothetical protein [Bacillus cereus]MDF9545755.1 hypothetical protein [Bacillus cereus]